MALLQLDDITYCYEKQPFMEHLHLEVGEGDILCLLGASGSGKTTLLRIIAGLEHPDRGQVVFDGREVTDVAPHRRGFGMMFQEFALFPHRSVARNVAFGLEMQKLPREEIRRRTGEMLALVGLSGFEDRRITELSGGERQRVAIARSLAPQPRLLLLDEPFGALDRALRERLCTEVRAILKRLGLTAVFVTHDQAEAYAVADRIAVMQGGRILQEAAPEDLWHRPETEAVARFLGFANLLPGRVVAPGQVQTSVGTFAGLETAPADSAVTVLVRPEAAGLGEGPGCTIHGTITERLFCGRNYRVKVTCDSGDELSFELAATPPAEGEPVNLTLDPQGIQLLGK